jgi:hypothetical protein
VSLRVVVEQSVEVEQAAEQIVGSFGFFGFGCGGEACCFDAACFLSASRFGGELYFSGLTRLRFGRQTLCLSARRAPVGDRLRSPLLRSDASRLFFCLLMCCASRPIGANLPHAAARASANLHDGAAGRFHQGE